MKLNQRMEKQSESTGNFENMRVRRVQSPSHTSFSTVDSMTLVVQIVTLISIESQYFRNDRSLYILFGSWLWRMMIYDMPKPVSLTYLKVLYDYHNILSALSPIKHPVE